MNKKKICFLIIVVLILCGAYQLKKQADTEPKRQKITLVGSTALQPLAQQVALGFQKENPNAEIIVQGGGSGTGLSQIQEKTVEIGNADIFAENKPGINAKKLVDHKVAVVGIAPVVSRNLSVNNLSWKQLQAIFTGKITNWQEVGGPNLKITVINRAQGSGTRKTFEDIVLRGENSVNAQEQDSNGTVQKIVANTPGAISYLSFGYVNSSLKSLSINGIKANAKNVTTNSWKIWSYEHMYTNGQAKGITKNFLTYMMSDRVQGKTLKDAGYISPLDMRVTKDAQGKIHRK